VGVSPLIHETQRLRERGGFPALRAVQTLRYFRASR
jgi:hypothetical protein